MLFFSHCYKGTEELSQCFKEPCEVFFCWSERKLGVVTGWAPFTEIIGSISVAQIRLDLVHMGTHGPTPASTALHSSRDGGSCGHSSGWAGLVLQQLNEHAHLWAQPWHHAGPNAVHCVLIAVHQALEQLTVKPRTTRQYRMLILRSKKGGKLYSFLFVDPPMFPFLLHLSKHVLHSLTSTVWERPFAHDKIWALHPPCPFVSTPKFQSYKY